MERLTCSKCVLHSRVPGVTINENGVCSVCEAHNYNPKVSAAISKFFTKKFNRLINEVKSKNWTYDALVLFSGGKDSAYLLKLVKEEYGLRPLAFSVVHPLVNTTAVKNMDELAQKLGVDLFKFHPSEEVYKKLIRYALIEGHNYGLDESVGCCACSFTFVNIALITAIRMNIPIVFDGIDIDQSETPLYIEGDKLKSDAEKGVMPNGKMYEIAAKALGEDYKGSIYDFNFEELKDFNFPAYVGPFTFIDYDFKNNFKVFEELGFEANSFKKIFTNCDAVPFFSYFSLKRFDCLTYIRHYANEIRNGYPYFLQSKLDNDQNDGALSKETIEELLKEYKSAVLYVVDKKLDNKNITRDEEKRIIGMAPVHQRIYGKEVCDVFLEQALMVNTYGEFFDIDLASV